TAVLDSGPSNAASFTLNADGSFNYTPTPDFTGTDTFTYFANDGTVNSTPPATVTITVNAVNDAPSFTLSGGNQAVNEDAGAQAVADFAAGMSPGGGADEAGQVLTFNVSTDNDPLFAVLPAINATTGELTYTPAADANGSATITVTLSDDGGTPNGGSDTSAAQNFDITVNAVNDAPSFVVGSNQTVTENAGAQTVAGFATGISAGPADETGQVLTFNVVNDNNGLFAVQPAIDASGQLTYTPAADTTGSATVDVTLSDDGGTANGGADTSGVQNFTITVNAAGNNPPVAAADSYSVNEDATLNVTVPGVLGNDTDADLDTLSAVLDSNVSNGPLITLNPDGSFSYTPNADFNGSDSFTYHANDGIDDSNIVTVTITVDPVNDAPSFTLSG
ncbi:MAG: tandem-95 repeat protein, partial [Gammaproteobacteria bacterium]|nr:tandem-95 repeat protein [Gammaproteobacteria bacterium]